MLAIYISGRVLLGKRAAGFAVNECCDQRQTDESGVDLSAIVSADGLFDRKDVVVRSGLYMNCVVVVLQQRAPEQRWRTLGCL
jgi:hypothetical protein